MTDTTRPAVERMHPPAGLWKVLVNPTMRTILRTPAHRLVDDGLLLLSFVGRKSGTRYSLPVGYHWIDGTMCVLTNAGWRVNFRDGHPLAVRHKGQVRTGTALLREDADHVARVYRELIADAGHEKAGRRLGIRINVDRAPTHDELVEAVHTYGLSVIELDIGVQAPC